MQDTTPVKDKGEGQMALEKEQQQQQGKVEMTPVRRAELEPSPRGHSLSSLGQRRLRRPLRGSTPRPRRGRLPSDAYPQLPEHAHVIMTFRMHRLLQHLHDGEPSSARGTPEGPPPEEAEAAASSLATPKFQRTPTK